jgi:hypothetical protein
MSSSAIVNAVLLNAALAAGVLAIAFTGREVDRPLRAPIPIGKRASAEAAAEASAKAAAEAAAQAAAEAAAQAAADAAAQAAARSTSRGAPYSPKGAQADPFIIIPRTPSDVAAQMIESAKKGEQFQPPPEGITDEVARWMASPEGQAQLKAILEKLPTVPPTTEMPSTEVLRRLLAKLPIQSTNVAREAEKLTAGLSSGDMDRVRDALAKAANASTPPSAPAAPAAAVGLVPPLTAPATPPPPPPPAAAVGLVPPPTSPATPPTPPPPSAAPAAPAGLVPPPAAAAGLVPPAPATPPTPPTPPPPPAAAAAPAAPAGLVPPPAAVVSPHEGVVRSLMGAEGGANKRLVDAATELVRGVDVGKIAKIAPTKIAEFAKLFRR